MARKRDNLAKHDYPNWHEIKCLTQIYGDEEWDDAEIVVWNPIEKRKYRIVFCGSTRPDNENGEVGEINFILYPLDE